MAACAVALVMIGAAAVLLLSNAIKRLAGLLIAGFGAIGGLAALGASDGALIVGVAVLFAQTAIGAALVVRLQEAYSAIDAVEIDAADADDDAQDRAS
ncbi:hypothetical protein [Candidatus Viadribacter manganicus]|uniref:hypothetical protein n=1 Tax=Candidatus Viadribacter manganicus TaxID=1759059 RepID=UPI0012EA6536|nr:hypothetical protein [Candidatus Viadribacter manganicus]